MRMKGVTKVVRVDRKEKRNMDLVLGHSYFKRSGGDGE